jgi:hypothetical protein
VAPRLDPPLIGAAAQLLRQGLALLGRKSDTAVHGLTSRIGRRGNPILVQAIFFSQDHFHCRSPVELFRTLPDVREVRPKIAV